MGMKKCPECGREISDKAKKCPQCGCDVKFKQLESKPQRETKKADNKIAFIGVGCILGIVLGIGIGIALATDNTQQPVKQNSNVTTEASGVSNEETNISAKENANNTGVLHSDELIITNVEISVTVEPYFEIIYEIKNNTEEVITFEGISIKEYDSNNTILGDYYSYNKNAMETNLDPGQSMKLDLTFSREEGISKVESTEYEFYDKNNNLITGTFSTPHIVETN